jgi:hypothetical protein
MAWNCVGWQETRVNGSTPQEAFLQYYHRAPGQNVRLLDASLYPDNPTCAFSPNNQSAGGRGGEQPTATALHFAGYTWAVRASGSGGPGPNAWSDAAALVDGNGHLHLQLIKDASAPAGFACSEVNLNMALGYGAYSFDLLGPVDALGNGDPHVVLGMFLYQNDSNEIDIEMARWGDASTGANNADCVVQPSVPARRTLWSMPAAPVSRHTIVYEPKRVQCLVTAGPQGPAIFSWQLQDGQRIPPPEGLLVHINLWLAQGKTYNLTQPVDVTVANFSFVPWEAT